jgi:hypothetical protein
MFEYMASRHGTQTLLVRLNYANDLRYGVLLDIAQKVHRQEPIDLNTGWLNAIWQGDANAGLLRGFDLCANPPTILNQTGPDILSVRALAIDFAKRFGIDPPRFVGAEQPTAYLNNAKRFCDFYGPLTVATETLIEWTAHWVRIGGATLNKPTHFETRDGKY